MKKIILLFVAVLGIICGCTSNMDRANELITEYQHKADSVNAELKQMASVIELTQEQYDYIVANAQAYGYRTMVVVARNWQLTTEALEAEAVKALTRAEMLSVPLTAEQQTYASKYAEAKMYSSTVAILQRWIELHQ